LANREQLLEKISEIIMDNVHDYGEYIDHREAAKQILELIEKNE